MKGELPAAAHRARAASGSSMKGELPGELPAAAHSTRAPAAPGPGCWPPPRQDPAGAPAARDRPARPAPPARAYGQTTQPSWPKPAPPARAYGQNPARELDSLPQASAKHPAAREPA